MDEGQTGAAQPILGPGCPKCDGRLVLRTVKAFGARGKGSSFWGCTNWPRCTYTREIDDKVRKWLNPQQGKRGHARGRNLD